MLMYSAVSISDRTFLFSNFGMVASVFVDVHGGL
jgi:hypothetical protein